MRRARPSGDSPKRVRLRTFQVFGDLLREWRGARDIEAVVRQVRKTVPFDAATLRGWEYGWIGRPDPLRLIALARVYGRSLTDVMNALAAARDLPRHQGELQDSGQTAGDLPPAELAGITATLDPTWPHDEQGAPVSVEEVRASAQRVLNASRWLFDLAERADRERPGGQAPPPRHEKSRRRKGRG